MSSSGLTSLEESLEVGAGVVVHMIYLDCVLSVS